MNCNGLRTRTRRSRSRRPPSRTSSSHSRSERSTVSSRRPTSCGWREISATLHAARCVRAALHAGDDRLDFTVSARNLHALDELSRPRSGDRSLRRRVGQPTHRQEFQTMGTPTYVIASLQPRLLTRTWRRICDNRFAKARRVVRAPRLSWARRDRGLRAAPSSCSRSVDPGSREARGPQDARLARTQCGWARSSAGVLTTGADNTNGPESTWLFGGLLADEWGTASTFVQNDEVDKRAIGSDNSTVTIAFRKLHRVRTAVNQAHPRMAAVPSGRTHADRRAALRARVRGDAAGVGLLQRHPVQRRRRLTTAHRVR